MAFIYYLLLAASAAFTLFGSHVAGRILGPILIVFFFILFMFSLAGGLGERHAK